MLKQGFQPVSMQLSSVGEVARRGQHLLVDGKDLIQCPLIDVQCWECCTKGLNHSSTVPARFRCSKTHDKMLVRTWLHLCSHEMAVYDVKTE